MNCCPLCGGNLNFGGLIVLADRGMVVRDGLFALLPPIEVKVLQALIDAAPRVVSKPRFMELLYNLEQDEAEMKIIDVLVCRLRKRLKPLGVTISTHWGQGYSLVFTGQIRTIGAAA